MSICKICFKEINKNGVNSYLKNPCICQACFNAFEPKFYETKIENVEALIIYDYDDTIRKYLFQLKGCFDIELAPIFLSRFKYELKMRYQGYVIVPFPSSKEDDEIRGFNHVEEIFKVMGLPYERVLQKKFKFKQSDLSKEEREKIRNKIEGINLERIRGKKVLIVDDVTTTGSSIKAAIEIIKLGNPKTIKVALLAKKQSDKKSNGSKLNLFLRRMKNMLKKQH